MGGKGRSAKAEMRPPRGKGIRKMPSVGGIGGERAKGLLRHPANAGEGKGPRAVVSCSQKEANLTVY